MEKQKIEYHLLEEHKVFCDGEIISIDHISSSNPLAWVNIDETVFLSCPTGRYSLNGILFPIKETEAFLKSEYKSKFNIDIPGDIHQWPFEEKEARNKQKRSTN